MRSLRRGNADLRQQLRRAPPRRLGREVGVRLDRFHDLPADRVERIEARQRVLEDHADPPPAHAPHALGRECVDALAAEPHLAAGDAAGRVDEPDHGEAGERLAGAGLADHAEDLAARDVERDAVDGGEEPASRGEGDAQVADGQDGAHRRFPVH